MPTQEKLNPVNGHAPSVTRGMRDLACDVISLAELQGKLLVVDLRESRAQLIRSAVRLGLAPVLALAALPVFLLGLSGWISHTWEWPPETVQMTLAGLVVLIAGFIGWRGWNAFSHAFETLARSRTELGENLRWIKTVLRTPPTEQGRDPADHIRSS